jgi:predicted transcriptional regulator
VESVTKLTIQLSSRTDDILAKLAERQETTKAQVVRRAIALLSYLEDESAKGGRVVVKRPDGETEIVLESTL